MKKNWLILVLILSAVLLLSGCAMLEDLIPFEDLPDVIKPPLAVDVMLQENEGIVIKGENPVSVKAGGDVSFAIEIRDGYKLEGLGQGAVYEDGVVTLTNVKFPTTVEIETRTLNNLNVEVNNNTWQGEVTECPLKLNKCAPGQGVDLPWLFRRCDALQRRYHRVCFHGVHLYADRGYCAVYQLLQRWQRSSGHV